jgi:hypothetical protein
MTYRIVINFQGNDFSSNKWFSALGDAEEIVKNFLDCIDGAMRSYYYCSIEFLEAGQWVTYKVYDYDE